VLECLLDGGAAVNQADQVDLTPLHFAVLGGSAACVAALVRCGASEAARDLQGKTPLELARFLTKRGGDGACPDVVAWLAKAPSDRAIV